MKKIILGVVVTILGIELGSSVALAEEEVLVYRANKSEVSGDLFAVYQSNSLSGATSKTQLANSHKGQNIVVIEKAGEIIGYASYKVFGATNQESAEIKVLIQQIIIEKKSQSIGYGSDLLSGLTQLVHYNVEGKVSVFMPDPLNSPELKSFAARMGLSKQVNGMRVATPEGAGKLEIIYYSGSALEIERAYMETGRLLDRGFDSQDWEVRNSPSIFQVTTTAALKRKRARESRGGSEMQSQSRTVAKEQIRLPTALASQPSLMQRADKFAEEIIEAPINVLMPVAYCYMLGRWFGSN